MPTPNISETESVSNASLSYASHPEKQHAQHKAATQMSMDHHEINF